MLFYDPWIVGTVATPMIYVRPHCVDFMIKLDGWNWRLDKFEHVG